MAFITVSCILLKMLPLSDETIFLPVFTVISFEDEFEVFVIAEFLAKAALRHLPSKHIYKKNVLEINFFMLDIFMLANSPIFNGILPFK